MDIFSLISKDKLFSNLEQRYFSKLANLGTNSNNSLISVSYFVTNLPKCLGLKNSCSFQSWWNWVQYYSLNSRTKQFQVTSVVERSFRLSHHTTILLFRSQVATLNFSSSFNSISVKVFETFFNQFFAATTSKMLKKVSQPSCLASFISLDNLTLCFGVVGYAKVAKGSIRY